jgi:nucleotide-binding universal stress UspA family protein
MAPSGSPDWPRRILVPLDGSPLAESALDQVEALDPRGASELFLTSVIQTMPPAITPWGFPPELMVETSEQREVQAREALQLMVNESRARGRAAHQRIRIGSKVAKEVLRVADQERCDLIAIASHGAGGIDRAMFGSVADQIVRHSHVPVLVLRPSLRNTAPRLSPVGASSREVL